MEDPDGDCYGEDRTIAAAEAGIHPATLRRYLIDGTATTGRATVDPPTHVVARSLG